MSLSKPKKADQESLLTASVKSKLSESDLDEEDEWAAIQKFNALLHFEEQKQLAQREAERKKLLKQELEAQWKSKADKREQQRREDQAYHYQLMEHLKVLDVKESEKTR